MRSTGIVKIASIIILLLPCAAAADDWKNESVKGPPGKTDYRHGDRDHGRGRDDRGGGHYKEDRDRGYRDHREYRGYREHPYERGRHYGHYKHEGHRYEYQGHWRSWDEWDSYAKRNPDVYKNGDYYRDSVHLMFRFCDPGGAGGFFFSIGR